MKKLIFLFIMSLVLFTLSPLNTIINRKQHNIYATQIIFLPETKEEESEEALFDDENNPNQTENESEDESDLPANSQEPEDEKDNPVIPPTPPSTFDPNSISVVSPNPTDETEAMDPNEKENNLEEGSQTANTIETSNSGEGLIESQTGKPKNRSVEPGRIVPLPNADLPAQYTLNHLHNWTHTHTDLIQKYYILQSSIIKKMIIGTNYECSIILEPIIFNFLEESLHTIVETF